MKEKPCPVCTRPCLPIRLAWRAELYDGNDDNAGPIQWRGEPIGMQLCFCDECRRKAWSLIERGHTPAQIALTRTDLIAELELYQKKFNEFKGTAMPTKPKPKKPAGKLIGMGLPDVLIETPAPSKTAPNSVSRETFGDFRAEESTRVEWLLISDIAPNPYQPRRVFSTEELEELAASIKEHGVLQPVIVRATPHAWKSGPNGSGLADYQLIAGERRLRASKMAGLNAIPAILRICDDRTMAELAIVENAQRVDVSVIEQAKAMKRLMDEFGATNKEISEKAGVSHSKVSNRVRLLDLPEDVQQLVSEGKLSEAHGRALLRYKKFPEFLTVYATHVAERSLPTKLIESGLIFGFSYSENPEQQALRNSLYENNLLTDVDACEYSDVVKEDEVLFEHSEVIFKGRWFLEDDEDEYLLFCLDVKLASELMDRWQQQRNAQITIANQNASNVLAASTSTPATGDDIADKRTALIAQALAGTPIQLRELHYNQYETIQSYNCPKACTKECPCRGVGISYGGSEVQVCFAPDRMRGLKSKETREKNKARREECSQTGQKLFELMKKTPLTTLNAFLWPVVLVNSLAGAHQKTFEAVVTDWKVDFDVKKFQSYTTAKSTRLEMLARLGDLLPAFVCEVLLRDEIRKAADGNESLDRAKWLLEVLED